MSESTRIKNEAIDRAREDGRLVAHSRGEPGASLAKAPDAAAAFEQAQKATQPLEQPTPGPQRPPITAAQQHDPIQSLSARDAQKTTAAPAQQSLVAEAVKQHRQEQGLGTPEMIQRQQPKPELHMDTPIGRGVDAQAFDQQWAAEQARAQAHQDRVAAAFEAARQEPTKDQQQDQGRGMSR